jgi:hypothetical protein
MLGKLSHLSHIPSSLLSLKKSYNLSHSGKYRWEGRKQEEGRGGKGKMRSEGKMEREGASILHTISFW